ncbi:MAG: GNAT family N-acetyltransferase [Deltaproteobacteria bacterium]
MNSRKTDEQASVVIRRMGPAELGEVTDAWYRSLISSLAYMRPEQLRSEEAYKGFFREVVVTSRDLWVAELGSRVAGVLALEGDEIDRLYVAPEAQRRLVGTALLEYAKALRPNGLTLVTHQRNTGARRFYERHGFEAREFGTSPPPENEPDVTYAWSGSNS